MNGTSYVNGVSSLEPESPKSHWSDLTGATSESDAADNEDGSLPAAPVQPRYRTRSVGHVRDSAGIPLERDGLVELCETRPRTSDTPSGAQTGDTAGLGEDSETNRARVENDVRLDPVIQGLPTIPPLFEEGVSPMIPTPKAKTPTSEDRGEEAHESEASNKDSMPATQKTATAISTRATSNEQDDEMVKAGNMPTMTTGMSGNETSTDDEPETANTGTSSGQPDFWTATDRRSTQIPLTEQQAHQEPFSVFLTHPNVKDVPQQRDRDVASEPLDPPLCCESPNARFYRQQPGWRILCRAASDGRIFRNAPDQAYQDGTSRTHHSPFE